MPINAHPEFGFAEKEYNSAKTLEEKISALKKMISYMPQHKGAESLRADLRGRLKRLEEKQEKAKKSGKTTKETIKKEIMQACIVGFPNTGKSSLFSALTGVHAKISSHGFSTLSPEVGMMNFHHAQVQIIDMPPFPNHNLSILNNTDTLLLVIDNPEQIQKSQAFLQKTRAKQIIIFNKTDLLSETEKRKLFSFLQSKKYNFILFSCFLPDNIDELKKKIFDSFPIIRIYLKEPGKSATEIPLILKQNSTIKDAAEKILKGFSLKVKKTRIWGPSSKFSAQSVGLEHICKDWDIVEFQTF
jgi:ribosome-interacting GTPase 1